jgi:hypothetical protein
MKTTEKITIVAREFLRAFDANELFGRKKNLIRTVDAFCYVVKCVMYKHITLSDVASLVNKEFEKNGKSFLHSDVISAVRRHLMRMEDGVNGDVFYQEVYNEVIEKLMNKFVLNTDTIHAETETKKG